MRLEDYMVSDIGFDFLYGGYRGFASLSNIFDEKYSHAIQYSAPERALNIGFKKLYWYEGRNILILWKI